MATKKTYAMFMVSNVRYIGILYKLSRKWVAMGRIPSHVNHFQLAQDALSRLYETVSQPYRDTWDTETVFDPKDPEVGLMALGLILRKQLREETRSSAPGVGEISPNMGKKPVVSLDISTTGLFREVARLKNEGHKMGEIAQILSLKSGWVKRLREDIQRMNPNLSLPKKSAKQRADAWYNALKRKPKRVRPEPVAEPKATLANGAWV